MYQYTRDNPLRFVDPTGKAVCLSDNNEERTKQLAAAQNAVGKDAGKYVYTSDKPDKDGKYYLKVYSMRKWATPRPARLSNFGETPPRTIAVELKPGATLNVCYGTLPQQQGHPGDVVRFALSLKWGHQPAVFSKRFEIAGKDQN